MAKPHFVKRNGKWVVEGDDGKPAALPEGVTSKGDGLAPLAYAGGGGLLGYFLAKSMVDEDDKEQGTFKKLLPWLAAAGGALGGYSLLNKKAAVADGTEVPIGEDRKPNPTTGGWRHAVGVAGDVGAIAAGGRAIANYRFNRGLAAQRYIDALNALQAERGAQAALSQAAEARVVSPSTKADSAYAVAEQKARNAQAARQLAYREAGPGVAAAEEYAAKHVDYPKVLAGRAARTTVDPNSFRSRIGNLLSRNASGKWGKWLNWKGQAAALVPTIGASVLGHWLGSKKNDEANEIIKELSSQYDFSKTEEGKK